jgi:hypothetical protein
MATPGHNNALFFTGEAVLALCPEHAATIAGDGFTKGQVKSFLFQRARFPIETLSDENLQYRRKFRDKYGEFTESNMIPIAKEKDFVVIVLGGPGKQSCFIPTFGDYSVTQRIES